MRGFQLDWRWVALILFVALLANGRSLPWPVTALALGAGGIYLMALGWRSAGRGGRGGRGGRVTYWRGQRIELPSPPRRRWPAMWGELAPALIYALIGLALVLVAISIVLNQVLLPGVV
ncbi:hypothetical protein K2Z83_19060 [Oscillochloris sp. ZM17-4]|uniref:hypothetical protein n=1 Tax=Oscillochloris sp. ZM17-4 TaxID=2866714 RepID=UPI001C730F96|nr:hypothetical protein [Oscillochloris sp. ZM17-4]MBX0329773.1 hypothetical protein [Oscillochloris sp. ZM17-4]